MPLGEWSHVNSGLLIGITAASAVATILVALWVKSRFDSAGKLSAPAAIGLGIVFYIPIVVTLLVALSGTDRGSLPLPAGWALTIGLVFLATGIGMIAAGRLTFGSRARVYGLKGDKLITRGTYAWSRNPQYFGTFLFLIGAAFIATSIVTLLLATAFFGLLHVYIRQMEEPHLSRLFGDSYARYRNETYRYLDSAMSAVEVKILATHSHATAERNSVLVEFIRRPSSSAGYS